MEKKKSIKKYFTLGFFAVAVLAIVLAIVATPTKFYTEKRDDGNYDLELRFVNRVSSKVKVPAEYDGKKVTSFLVEAYYQVWNCVALFAGIHWKYKRIAANAPEDTALTLPVRAISIC